MIKEKIKHPALTKKRRDDISITPLQKKEEMVFQ
jgi:hypothetical protein